MSRRLAGLLLAALVWAFPTQEALARECLIKGNINRHGERIYHVPGSRWYARTKISPGKGERWFCSEKEAIAAGWRPPLDQPLSEEARQALMLRGGGAQTAQALMMLAGAGGKRRGGGYQPPGKCRIKGNINRRGERIYHMPGSRWYARTKISPQKGERWFCSEAEARAAGWRPPRR